MKRYTFPKAEHLCLKKEIEELFTAGSQSATMFPLRTTFRIKSHAGSGPRVKVLISVSKRKFKHAVDRNRAKRQVREAYRLQKEQLISRLPKGLALNVAFIWVADKPVSSRLVHTRMHTALRRVSEKVNQAAAPQTAATTEP